MHTRAFIKYRNNCEFSISNLSWRLNLVILLTFIIISSQTVYAQDDGNIEIFVSGGVLSANCGNSEIINPEDSKITTRIEQGRPYMLGISFAISRFFSLEISMGAFTNNYIVDLYGWLIRENKWEHLYKETTTEIFHLHLNGVYNIISGWITPYVSGGIGWIAFIENASFSPNIGFGLKLFPIKSLGLKVDLRYFSTSLEDNVDWSTFTDKWYEFSIPYSDKVEFKQVTIGIIYRF